MAKVCKCCRDKIVAAFREKEMPAEFVDGFIELIEEITSAGVVPPSLPELVDAIESASVVPPSLPELVDAIESAS